MKINATVNDETHAVEANESHASVDDRHYEIESSSPEPGVVLLKNDNRVYEAVVAPAGSADAFTVSVGGRTYDVRLTDPKRLRSSGSGHEHGDGMAEVKSAMPGKVVRILVEADAEVEKGQGVIVVEAMKMQNELKSPKAGKVAVIKAEEGQTIGAGDVLIVIE